MVDSCRKEGLLLMIKILNTNYSELCYMEWLQNEMLCLTKYSHTCSYMIYRTLICLILRAKLTSLKMKTKFNCTFAFKVSGISGFVKPSLGHALRHSRLSFQAPLRLHCEAALFLSNITINWCSMAPIQMPTGTLNLGCGEEVNFI